MKYVVGIAEIVLWTVDQARALAFYRDLLGLEVISRPEMANVFLKVGQGAAGIPQMIVLVPKPEDIKGRPSGYQLHHLALELPDDQFEQQHNTLVSLCGTLRRRAVCEEAIEACLQIVNAMQCERPGSPENVRRIILSSRRWSAR